MSYRYGCKVADKVGANKLSIENADAMCSGKQCSNCQSSYKIKEGH